MVWTASVLSALDAKLHAQPADADGTRHLDVFLPVVDTDKFNHDRTYQSFCALPDHER